MGSRASVRRTSYQNRYTSRYKRAECLQGRIMLSKFGTPVFNAMHLIHNNEEDAAVLFRLFKECRKPAIAKTRLGSRKNYTVRFVQIHLECSKFHDSQPPLVFLVSRGRTELVHGSIVTRIIPRVPVCSRHTWSASSVFRGETTKQIPSRFSSKSNGRAQGRVFPGPVPAITVPSSPRVSASVTLSRQSYGSIVGQAVVTAFVHPQSRTRFFLHERQREVRTRVFSLARERSSWVG